MVTLCHHRLLVLSSRSSHELTSGNMSAPQSLCRDRRQGPGSCDVGQGVGVIPGGGLGTRKGPDPTCALYRCEVHLHCPHGEGLLS